MVFTGVANTTSPPIGWEGGYSHEAAGKVYIFTTNTEIIFIGVILTFTYHTKQLNPWLNPLASHVVIYSQLLTKGRWGHLKAIRALMDARQAWKKCQSESKLFNIQQY